MSDPIIYRLHDIAKSYRGRSAPAVLVPGVMEIRRGEICVIVGPSGAGKSTLLRILGMIEPPTAGWLMFDNQRYDANTQPELSYRRRVVYLFQRPLLLSQSVYDNVNYGLRVRGIKDEQNRVQRAIAQVGLQHLTHANTRTLSGGEAQRVALARALVIEPDILLLDEPTANLDPANVEVIERVIRERNQQQGMTIVLVTHNLFQARRLAQQVGLMLDGKLIEYARASAFFESPVDPRTSAFIRGDMIF